MGEAISLGLFHLQLKFSMCHEQRNRTHLGSRKIVAWSDELNELLDVPTTTNLLQMVCHMQN